MYLFNTESLKLVDFLLDHRPPYIILSHTWEDEEVLFQDVTKEGTDPTLLAGWAKVASFCDFVKKDGWEWVWMDTLCIDQKSSAEWSEAINSMFQWYREAVYCVAYLADVSILDDASNSAVGSPKYFHKSRWFKRGWTLQELLAPAEVMFLDREWTMIGTRHNLQEHICRAAGIAPKILGETYRAGCVSVATTMSWASHRKTSRAEDAACSLLGLFHISMLLLYGEGGVKAFWRLQLEILTQSSDESIFAWTNIKGGRSFEISSMLASSPQCFARSANISPPRISYMHSFSGRLSGSRITFDGTDFRIKRFSAYGTQCGAWSSSNGLYAIPLKCAPESNERALIMLTMSKASSSKPDATCVKRLSAWE
ncbi:MAG: hypothetical protein Q9220_007063 [cf. Caloplaca sp. 1 TL-2023]